MTISYPKNFDPVFRKATSSALVESVSVGFQTGSDAAPGQISREFDSDAQVSICLAMSEMIAARFTISTQNMDDIEIDTLPGTIANTETCVTNPLGDADRSARYSAVMG